MFSFPEDRASSSRSSFERRLISLIFAGRKGDETHGSSLVRTFYDKQSLIEQTRAVHMPLSQSDNASLFNGETIRLIADEHDLELLGVWERLGRA